MKKLGILLLACITALNLSAEEFWIGNLTFKIKSSTTVELIDADSDNTKVILSETIDFNGNSYTIISIGEEAFIDCSSLTSVTIPNSVTSIEEGVFAGCSLLTSVDIPTGVKHIGYWAFSGCSSLKKVAIPNSVTSIGEEAFPEHTQIIRQ